MAEIVLHPGFVDLVGFMLNEVANFSLFISDVICPPEAEPPTPVATVTVEGNTVTGTWTAVPGATAYQVFYAPFPQMSPIASIDVEPATSVSVQVPSGLSLAGAVVARNGLCYDLIGKLSNVVNFTGP